MKRFHVHLGVPDLAARIRFYSDLFGMAPTVEKPDYAKWMIDDPRVNFAISRRSSRTGLNHLGLQADSAEELASVRTRFTAADASTVHDEPNVSCCYARSDKHWVRDPQGIPWEAFHSLGTVPFFGEGNEQPAGTDAGETVAGGCCSTTQAGSDAPMATCCAPAETVAAQPAGRRTACCS